MDHLCLVAKMRTRNSSGFGSRGSRRLISVTVLLPWLLAAQAPDAIGEIVVGQKAPNFQVQLVDAENPGSKTLANYSEHTLLLEFWATWCGPCVPASKHLGNLHKRFTRQDLQVLSVSSESMVKVSKYLGKHSAPYQVAIDTTRAIQKAYNVRAIPRAFLISRESKIVWMGNPLELTEDALEEYFKSGHAPASRLAIKHSKPRRTTGRPVLFIRISQTSKEAELKPSPVATSARGNAISCKATAQPLASILRSLLEVAPTHIDKDPSFPAALYDFEFEYYPLSKNVNPRQLAIDAICKACGVSVEQVFEEREVWVVRRRGTKEPPKGSGPPSKLPDGSGRFVYSNVPLSSFLYNIEFKWKVVLEDETGLKGRYDLWNPLDCSFDELRTHLSEEYGLVIIVKEQRKVKLFRLRAITPSNGKDRPNSKKAEEKHVQERAGG